MDCAIQRPKEADLINAAGAAWPAMELRFQDEHGGDPTSISASGWLAEVREMRGRVFYDEGHRPFFRLADGSFHDSDPADLHAYREVSASLRKPRGRSL